MRLACLKVVSMVAQGKAISGQGRKTVLGWFCRVKHPTPGQTGRTRQGGTWSVSKQSSEGKQEREAAWTRSRCDGASADRPAISPAESRIVIYTGIYCRLPPNFLILQPPTLQCFPEVANLWNGPGLNGDDSHYRPSISTLLLFLQPCSLSQGGPSQTLL